MNGEGTVLVLNWKKMIKLKVINIVYIPLILHLWDWQSPDFQDVLDGRKIMGESRKICLEFHGFCYKFAFLGVPIKPRVGPVDKNRQKTREDHRSISKFIPCCLKTTEVDSS